MNDLISRSALLETLKEHHDYIMQEPEISKTIKWCEAACFNRTIDALETAPAVDAVEVVRCKDCKHGQPSNAWEEFWYCEVWTIHHRGDNFCSYGERRADDAD